MRICLCQDLSVFHMGFFLSSLVQCVFMENLRITFATKCIHVKGREREQTQLSSGPQPLPFSLYKCCLHHWWGWGRSCDFCSLQVSFHPLAALQREYTKESMWKVMAGRKNKISAYFCYFRTAVMPSFQRGSCACKRVFQCVSLSWCHLDDCTFLACVTRTETYILSMHWCKKKWERVLY